jgi:hypothetical protein
MQADDAPTSGSAIVSSDSLPFYRLSHLILQLMVGNPGTALLFYGDGEDGSKEYAGTGARRAGNKITRWVRWEPPTIL